jgi:hypothetical protein
VAFVFPSAQIVRMRSDNSRRDPSSLVVARTRADCARSLCLSAALVAISCAPILSARAQNAELPGWTSASRANETNYTHGDTRALIVLRDLPALVGRPLADIVRTFSGSLRSVCRQLEATPIASEAGGAMATSFDDGATQKCILMAIRSERTVHVVVGVSPNDPRVDVNAAARALAQRFLPASRSATQPLPPLSVPRAVAQSSSLSLQAGWPAGGDTPSTTADVDWPQAVALGLNPRRDIRPARYECFTISSARRVNPLADGLLSVHAAGKYRYSSATQTADGTWLRTTPTNGIPSVQFSGPLTTNAAVVETTDAGQMIKLQESNAPQRELLCYLAGPASEMARLQMVNTSVANEALSCKFSDGGVTPVSFSGGRYTSARGSGVYRDFSLLETGNRWSGGFEFDGGPFEHARGFLRIDKQGRRVIAIGVTVSTSRGYWYSGNETTPVAECLSATPVRPPPVFGVQAVPRTIVTAGPAGQFAVQGYNSMNNTIPIHVYSFVANGWYSSDMPEGRPINCMRTKPSGEPMCLAYELQPGRIRMQENAGEWTDATWESLVVTRNGLEIGGRTYRRLAPLTGLRLSGVYSTSSGTSSGSISGVLSTIVTEGEYAFQADGTFTAASSLFARTGIGTGIGGTSPVVGSSSSGTDQASRGRYRIDGNWLVLTNSDGREVREFIHMGFEELPQGQSPPYIYIGGELYSRP